MDVLNFLGGQGMFILLGFALIVIYVVNRIKSRRR